MMMSHFFMAHFLHAKRNPSTHSLRPPSKLLYGGQVRSVGMTGKPGVIRRRR